MAKTYGIAKTDTDGVFSMEVYLYPGVGASSCWANVSTHYYDLMKLRLSYGDVEKPDRFYYLVRSGPVSL